MKDSSALDSSQYLNAAGVNELFRKYIKDREAAGADWSKKEFLNIYGFKILTSILKHLDSHHDFSEDDVDTTNKEFLDVVGLKYFIKKYISPMIDPIPSYDENSIRDLNIYYDDETGEIGIRTISGEPIANNDALYIVDGHCGLISKSGEMITIFNESADIKESGITEDGKVYVEI